MLLDCAATTSKFQYCDNDIAVSLVAGKYYFIDVLIDATGFSELNYEVRYQIDSVAPSESGYSDQYETMDAAWTSNAVEFKTLEVQEFHTDGSFHDRSVSIMSISLEGDSLSESTIDDLSDTIYISRTGLPEFQGTRAYSTYSALPQYKRVTSRRVGRTLDLQVWDSPNLRF